MKRMIAVIFTVLTIVALPTIVTVTASSASSVSYHEGGDGNGNNGGDYGDNDNRRCHNSENCRGSFSPGPFDRSPVDIHDNNFCISPDCSGNKDRSGSDKDGKGQK